MVPASRHTARCIHCAFRKQQQLLQSRRLPHSQFHASSSRSVRIRYSGKREEGDAQNYSFRRLNPLNSFQKVGGDGDGPQRADSAWTETLRSRLIILKEELRRAPLLEQLQKESVTEGTSRVNFNRIWSAFTQDVYIPESGKLPFLGYVKDAGAMNIRRDLRQTFVTRGLNALDGRIKFHFYAHLTGARFTHSDIKNQQALADLRYPSEWFPATRIIQRSIHLHVGPTNSGKTYQALQRLEQANTGVYAGPLRLLAHEVYTRMNAKGRPCTLVTGEERRPVPQLELESESKSESKSEEEALGALSACTVEMVPLNKTLDVAVIDEIQMIGNAERGWAWTQALLGVKAKEVHLCGEERTVPLIREICATVGEPLQVHRYERLSPLKVADESLDGNLSQLRKGDCIVSFSVMGIHSLRRQIERRTGRKVATVYGSLPPETRAQQARLFNDPSNEYDFLVASDAVGMGLNLAIKRIIFEAANKFDGYQRRTLSVADIKQIAGRAGRYRIAEQANEEPVSIQDLAAAKRDSSPSSVPENVGIVTTLEKFDFPIVADAMRSEPEPVRTAGLFPPAPVLERFASYFPPGTPFSYILTRLHELSQMHTRFHLCGLKDQVWIADLIEPVQGLTITDRNIICSAPASATDEPLWRELMPAYARCVGEQSGGNIIDIEALPLEVLEADVSASREYLRELERLHKGVVAYLWLSYRFAGIFSARSVAFHVKELVEGKIEQVLGQFSFSEGAYRKIAKQRVQQVLRDLDQAVALEEEGGKDGTDGPADVSAHDKDVEDGHGRLGEQLLQQQTSLTSGGDHFGGEEDMGIGLSDLPESDLSDEDEESLSDLTVAKHLGNPVTLETELADAEIASETQAQRTESDHAKIEDNGEEAEDASPLRQQSQAPQGANHNQFGVTMPPKHLAQLGVDLNATEMERNATSRP